MQVLWGNRNSGKKRQRLLMGNEGGRKIKFLQEVQIKLKWKVVLWSEEATEIMLIEFTV